MVKHSYKLPRSASVPVSGNGTVNVPFDLNYVRSKRRPDRPPKPQPEPVQNVVPIFVHGVQNSMATVLPNMVVGPGAVYVSVGSVNGAAPAVGVGDEKRSQASSCRRDKGVSIVTFDANPAAEVGSG
ncbi:Uncharacterized protein Fot_25716 [Forsythia ovata]|uniref:Uncharacterized protein n=1 Tax=Forsythia ovata TaxID=205694 RepID=A0ABD1UAY0_9LAMI